METILLNLVNSASFGSILFLLALGLSLIYGVMGILNLAHGALYMAGAYIGIAIHRRTGSYPLALIGGGAGVGLIGLALEVGFIRRLYGRTLDQILLTFGFVYIITNVIQWIWGSVPRMMNPPAMFSGSISIMDSFFPTYRLFLLGIGLLMGVFLWWFQERTLVGAIVRAGMDDREMASGLGVNLNWVYVGVFVLGALMAGFAGSVGAPVLGAYLDLGWQIMFLGFVVVVVGGVGSVQGALLGAMLIGVIDTMGKAYFPDFAMFTMYLVMVVILMVRPAGLLPR